MKQNTSIITQILVPLSFWSLLMSSLFLSIQALLFYLIYLSPKMALSRADRENHRKPGQHCFASPQSGRGGFASTLSVSLKGKYGVSSLLDVWVQPVTMWVRAWPQHLHKALPVLPPRRRKGQAFPPCWFNLKGMRYPLWLRQNSQIYKPTYTSRSWKEQRGLDVLAILFKQFCLFMWRRHAYTLNCQFHVEE